jgi:two-component system, OmpR family, sensor histidine kinase VanS
MPALIEKMSRIWPKPSASATAPPTTTPSPSEASVARAAASIRVSRLAPRRWLHLPARTVRLRLTLLYSGLFVLSGVALLVAMYLIFRSNSGVDLIVPNPATDKAGSAYKVWQNTEAARQVRRMYLDSLARDIHGQHEGLLESGVALASMTVVSIVLGWVVAGRVLRPLRAMTATTRQISERNLNERLAHPGPRDELKDLADTVDGLLARLEEHVAEQRRFAANASHELRTPLSITQTLLDVARNDPEHHQAELVDRLHEINTRAIDLTEALLLLGRAGQRSFANEAVDLSLIAEEAIETLLPLAERRGITIEASGETTPTVGSHALLLQMASNLVQNAIVHNLPERGIVWVATETCAAGVQLTVENSGEKLSPDLVATLVEPFHRGVERIRADHANAGLGLAIVKSIAETHDGTLTLTSRDAGGLSVTVQLPAGSRSDS